MVATFYPAQYQDRHDQHADGRFTREQHWTFDCDPGEQLASEPTGRFPDQKLAPHSIRFSYRQWGGYEDQKPESGAVWSAEVRATNPRTDRPPKLVSPLYLREIWYTLDDAFPENIPEFELRQVLDLELLRHE